MNWIIVCRIMMVVAFVIQIGCFPAIVNDNAKRVYGRLFGTRIDSNIYDGVFYASALFIIISYFLKMFIMG